MCVQQYTVQLCWWAIRRALNASAWGGSGRWRARNYYLSSILLSRRIHKNSKEGTGEGETRENINFRRVRLRVRKGTNGTTSPPPETEMGLNLHRDGREAPFSLPADPQDSTAGLLPPTLFLFHFLPSSSTPCTSPRDQTARRMPRQGVLVFNNLEKQCCPKFVLFRCTDSRKCSFAGTFSFLGIFGLF